MNKLRTLLIWGLLAAVTHVMGYTITVSPTQIEAGQSTYLIINLNNTETNLTAYQMSLYLPEGVTVQKKSNGKYAYTANADRHDGAFTVSVKDAADGSILIAVFSFDKDVLTGTNGELIRLPIEVASTVTTSLQGNIKNIEFTDVNAQAHKIADVNFTMTLEAVTSPAINFTDANVKAICIANWDTNGDGELSYGEAAAVTSITDNSGFKNNTTITSFDEFTYFTGLTQVGNSAFWGCNGLTSITIPNRVTSIGRDAFFRCRNMTSVTIPNGLTSIGDNAFRECGALASFTIPDSVVNIGNCAFVDCSNLTSFTIPENVTSIGYSIFDGCSLTSIIVETGNIKYDSRDNCNAIIETATNKLIAGCKNTIIPNNVTCIGYRSFEGCIGLTSVTIPESVTSIEDYAFEGCIGLASINIPSSVTSIGYATFWRCSGLTSVIIPESVTSIGNVAFQDCNNLTSVTVNITTPLLIESGTFSNRANATLYVPTGSKARYQSANYWNEFKEIIEIGDDVQEAEAYAVLNDSTLSFYYDNQKGNREGTVYNTLEYTSWYSSRKRITSVVFDNSFADFDGITSTNQWFGGFNNLTSITGIGNLNTSNVTVMSGMFSGCSGLTSLDVSNFNTENVTGMSGMFNGCKGLTSLDVSNFNTDNVTATTQMFNGCSGLTSLDVSNFNGDKVTNMIYMFSGCSGLTSLNLTNFNTENATYMHDMFSGCSGLTSLDVSNFNTNNVTDMDRMFYNCSSLNSIYIGPDWNTDQVTSSSSMFYNCNSIVGQDGTTYNSNYTDKTKAYAGTGGYLTMKEQNEPSLDDNIVFADANVKAICVSNWDTNDDGELSEAEAAAVTDLGTAFRDNTLIKQFNELQYFTGLTAIGDSAFFNCKNLASVTLPTNITSIGVRAFCYCSNSLTTVAIPSNVTSIGEYAFQSCTKLSSITIPKKVTKIGNCVFYNCNALASLKVQDGNTVYDSRGNCNAIIKTSTNTLIAGCKNTVIPEDVTAIGDYAFRKVTGLLSITIPQSVTSIGKSSFSNCTGLTDVWCYAQNVPNTKSNAFENSSIATATLHVPGAALCAYSSAAPWSGFASIVPIEENYAPVIAFADANVKAVCIANWDTDGDGELSEAEAEAVTSLGAAFRDNTLIKKFDELQYFTGLTAIPDSTFYNCKYLASVTLPDNVTSIGVRAFYYCSSSLTTVAIPSKVTTIGDYAFQNCTKLSSITIPKKVTKIGNFLFYNCNGLASIEVQDGNTVYDSRGNCNAIIKTSTNTLIAGCKNTVIPEDVTAIGDYAFRKVTGLVSITIPQSVTSIGKSSFSNCTGLTDVWCYAKNVPSTKTNAFDGSSIGTATLHVPASSVNAYSTTAPWKNFGSIVAIEGTESSNTIAGADITAHSGQQVKLPIELTNEDALTVVGISFTLTLPQGVTVATDMDGEPIFSLENARLNPNRFTVYAKQKANSSWNFLIVTNSATAALAGTEGAFMTVTLGIADGMANGSYDISLTDNKLSVKENNNLVNSIRLDDTSSTLTIDNSQTDFIMGDVNGDGDVDLSDAIMVIYYSMDETPANFNEAAADMNADGEIDLSDAILIIYRSLGVQLGSNARRKSKTAAECSDILQMGGDNNSFAMSLSNENTYLGFQCDIKLPEGATLYSIDLNESRAAGHTLMYNRLDDGSYRVVAFSLKGESFFGNMGDLLLFTTEGAEQGEVSMENIFFIDSDLNKVAFNDITAIATGISPAFADTNDTPVYNLAGQMVNVKSSNRKLQKGIYISKGRKTVK